MNQTDLLNGIPKEKLPVSDEDKLAREATEESHSKLVLYNIREAFLYARYVCRAKLHDEEVLSAAYLALTQAVQNYKPGTKAGIRFFAYAKPYVRGVIFREWKSRDVVKNAKHESLDVPLRDSVRWGRSVEPDQHDGPWTFSDVYKHELEPTGHCDPDFESIALHEKMDVLKPLIKTALSEHERMVIELAYFGNFNFEDIGRKLGVTGAAVQNTHTRAIRKLRDAAAQKPQLLNGD